MKRMMIDQVFVFGGGHLLLLLLLKLMNRLEFEAEHLTNCVIFHFVTSQQMNKRLEHNRIVLKRFQNDVQNSIGIQIETTFLFLNL
jgi:hypothetical protein